MSPFLHMITRVNSIPLSEEDYLNEIKIIKQIATTNGFRDNMIEQMNRKYKHKAELRRLTTLTKEIQENRKYITIEYNKTTMNIIQKTFRRYGYDIAYRTSNKIKSHTNNTQSTIDCETGVYKLKCNDCSAFYIGQTGRCFQKRFNEHIQEIGRKNIKSNYAQHLTEHKHTYTSYDQNLTVLQRLQKGDKLNRMEEIIIYKNRDNNMMLNDKAPYNHIYEYIMTI